MQERRRDSRIPVALDIEMKRGDWQHFVTDDVSRRGIFVRCIWACPVSQLMQLRVRLPAVSGSLEMMARVARQISPSMALRGHLFPGVGLEFFCLSGEALAAWDAFIQRARAIYQSDNGLREYEMYRLLENGGPSGTREKVTEPVPNQPVGDGRTNLIFRAYTLDRLEQFMNRDLSAGRFKIRIPYKFGEDTRVNLRVIHPSTDEEFALPGRVAKDSEKDSILVQFDGTTAGIVDVFKRFVATGQAPMAYGGTLCSSG